MVPQLNNTKWSELIQAMLDSPQMKPEFRLRNILAAGEYCTDWDRDWHYHIHPIAEIEWIEIRAASQDWLLVALRTHNIPFSMENGVPRVWGYTKIDTQPIWA
jgi:hypothetical protein